MENEKKYKLMNDKVVRPLFKNSPVGKELTAKIISLVLKVDYYDIYNNMRLITDDMLFSTKSLDSRTDMMLETNKYYVNIEFCYTKGTTRQKQTDSYLYEIFLGQVRKTEDYKKSCRRRGSFSRDPVQIVFASLIRSPRSFSRTTRTWVSRTFWRSGRTLLGDTESSSRPMARNSSVSSRSAPSSPQIPHQMPSLWALSQAILISRKTAG